MEGATVVTAFGDSRCDLPLKIEGAGDRDVGIGGMGGAADIGNSEQ